LAFNFIQRITTKFFSYTHTCIISLITVAIILFSLTFIDS